MPTTFAERRDALNQIGKQLLDARAARDAAVANLTQLQINTSGIPTSFKLFLDDIAKDAGGAPCFQNMASEALVMLQESVDLSDNLDSIVKAAG